MILFVNRRRPVKTMIEDARANHESGSSRFGRSGLVVDMKNSIYSNGTATSAVVPSGDVCCLCTNWFVGL